MTTQVKFLIGAGLFSIATAVVYWFLSYEDAGFAMLLFMGFASAFIGGYFIWKAGRGRQEYAEDDPDADPTKQAGEVVGWFPNGSIWPLVMGIALGIGLQGFIYGAWLLFFGAVLFVWAVVGLMMESRG